MNENVPQISQTPPLLLIVGGPPATGKTTLGKQLSGDLLIPFVHKDGIKETLFDRMGSGDRAWSRTLGLASYDLLYYFAEAQIAVRKPVIVESNFSPEHAAPVFAALRDKYTFRPFQIQCGVNGDVLFDRFVARSQAGTRHKGHNDELAHKEFAPILRAGHIPPMIFDPPGEIAYWDTTDFASIDYPGLLARVRRAVTGNV